MIDQNAPNVSQGYQVATQAPLDNKAVFVTIADLVYLGASNERPFMYYEGMITYCVQNGKTYRWKQRDPSEIGLMTSDFTYPLGSISYGIDYSSRAFNFVEVVITATGPSYTMSTNANILTLYADGVPVSNVDLSLYLDDSNLARLVSGQVVGNNLIVTRDDGTNFSIDVSALVGGGTATGFEANGNGFSLIGRNQSLFGPPGIDAVDASSAASGSGWGATGQQSFAAGFQNIASGQGSAVFNGLNVASGDYATAVGQQTLAENTYTFASGVLSEARGVASSTFNRETKAYGTDSFAAGDKSEAYSKAEFSIGMNGTQYTPNNATQWDAADRVFNIGNGQNALLKSDAMTVLKGGQAYYPSLTNTLIEAENVDSKIAITKDYLCRNTAWVDVNVNNGGSGTGAAAATFKYRTIGGKLFLRGSITPVASGPGNYTPIILPVGFRPDEIRNIPVTRILASFNESDNILLQINPTGEFTLSNTGSGFTTVFFDAEITLNTNI